MPTTGARKSQQLPKFPQQAPKEQFPPIPNDPGIPDVYGEGVNIHVTFNSVIFVFNKSLGGSETQPVAVVRTSPQQAFLIVQLLRKALKQYESDVGKFQIPDQLLKDLQIEGEL